LEFRITQGLPANSNHAEIEPGLVNELKFGVTEVGQVDIRDVGTEVGSQWSDGRRYL
jgi:hypothetical protein